MVDKILAFDHLFPGTDVIDKLVQNFHHEFQPTDPKDVLPQEDILHVDMTPSLGTLTKEAVKMMDDEVKIMIGATMKSLNTIPAPERKWDVVVRVLMQNPLLQPDDRATVTRFDTFTKNSAHEFQVNGSSDEAIVREVASWFKNLISDQGVLDSTKIDINVLGKIVAQTGVTITGFKPFTPTQERHEKTMMDVGVLRFPDADRPYFQVYSIKLTAWSQSAGTTFTSVNLNGISGEYYSRNFVPRKSVIDGLQAKSKATAIQMANDLFA